MPIVADLSGNSPLDPRKGGHYDVPILRWRGAQQVLTLSTSSVQSNKFANTARAIRVAPRGNCHYEVGVNPVADGNSPFLGGGAVEDLRVKPGERIAVIWDVSETDPVTITEDG